MDKLSELSKPVAWVLGTPSCKNLTTDTEYADWYLKHESTASPLYSQEYVSALLARIAEFEAEEARRKLIRDTWDNIPMWQPPKHTGRGARAMDKFSGLKAATCIAAKNFERWSKLAALTSESSSVLHSTTLLETAQLLSALLAELEEKDKRITTVTEEREFWRERVDGAEKEREEFRRRFNLERSYTEDADKRTAELEARLNHYVAVEYARASFDQTADIIKRADDAEREVEELRTKLATPVRLPPLMDGELCGKYGAKYGAAANAHNNAITACSIAICGAGFKSEVTAPKCVGDE